MKHSNHCLIVTSLALASCSSDPNPDRLDTFDDTFDRAALLKNVTENVLVPTYNAFRARSDGLLVAVEEYCNHLETADEQAMRTAVEIAWKNAMTTWQRAELMQVGPAADDGYHLHDLTYSWPVVSACAVDQAVMAHYNEPIGYSIAQSLANRRGLDAKEYALFSSDLNSVCAPQVQPEGWDQLSDIEKRAARCSFAAAAAADLADQAQTMLDGWAGSGGDFSSELMMAGTEKSRFASEHEALNTLFSALFYIDTVTKDQKLGKPAGLIDNACNATNAPCGKELESQFALHSKENIAANLNGFRMLFFGDTENGTEGSGFDDYLIARGHEDIASSIRSAVSTAQVAVDAIPSLTAIGLENEYASVAEAHAAVKVVTDSLKGDIPSILDLEIPTEADGDND